MTFATLAIGPTWRMELLRGLLEERGLLAVVQNDSLSTYYLGWAPPTAQLQVPTETLERARTVVEEARRDGNRSLENLRFALHERFSPGRRVRAMLTDVAFWLTLILVAFFVFSSIYFSCAATGVD